MHMVNWSFTAVQSYWESVNHGCMSPADCVIQVELQDSNCMKVLGVNVKLQGFSSNWTILN